MIKSLYKHRIYSKHILDSGKRTSKKRQKCFKKEYLINIKILFTYYIEWSLRVIFFNKIL